MKYLNIAKLKNESLKEDNILRQLFEQQDRGHDVKDSIIIHMATSRILTIIINCFEEK